MALSDTAHEIYSACQLAPGEGVVDAVARIESLLTEVRKQDDALIRQLLDALETCNDSGYYPYSYDEELVEAAAAAARARLAPPQPTA